MVESEFATRIVEGYELVQSLQEWAASVKTWIQDSPLDSAAEDVVIVALGDLLQIACTELDGVMSAYIEGLIDSRTK